MLCIFSLVGKTSCGLAVGSTAVRSICEFEKLFCLVEKLEKKTKTLANGKIH